MTPNPVLEITLLHILPPSLPTSPLIVSSLQTVRSLLAQKVHTTNSRFYQGISKPSEIFILGIWPSVAKHLEFLGNGELRDSVLGPQEGVMGWDWGMHVELGEDEGEVGVEKVGRMLDDAKCLEVGRWVVRNEKRNSFLGMLKRQEGEEKGGKGFRVVEGWRCDGKEAEDGVREYVRIRGWESEQDAGRGFEGHEGFVEGGALLEEEMGVCERIEVNVAWNLEP